MHLAKVYRETDVQCPFLTACKNESETLESIRQTCRKREIERISRHFTKCLAFFTVCDFTPLCDVRCFANNVPVLKYGIWESGKLSVTLPEWLEGLPMSSSVCQVNKSIQYNLLTKFKESTWINNEQNSYSIYKCYFLNIKIFIFHILQ